MNIGLTTPVKTIALGNAKAMDLLDEWRIDYFCRGDDTLEQACTAAGANCKEILPILTALFGQTGEGEARDWRRAGVNELIDHVVSGYHVRTRSKIAEVEDLLRALEPAWGDGPAEPELPLAAGLLDAFREAARRITAQMDHEEGAVFPRIGAMKRFREGRGPLPPPCDESLTDCIASIRIEHEAIAVPLRVLRDSPSTLRGDHEGGVVLEAAFRRFRIGVQRQIHLEGNVLFPRALSLEPESALPPPSSSRWPTTVRAESRSSWPPAPRSEPTIAIPARTQRDATWSRTAR